MLLLYLDVEHIVSVPYRGATFLNQSKSPIIKSLGKVSVPYRGATFLNKSISTYARKLHAVSVPYRGATFLNILLVVSVSCLYLFPSPIGELHFSIRIVNHLQVQNVFPSPIGELHFSIITGKNEKELFTPVSVPYRGATFLNY